MSLTVPAATAGNDGATRRVHGGDFPRAMPGRCNQKGCLTGWIHASVGRLRPYEHQVILAALAIALVVALIRQWRSRR